MSTKLPPKRYASRSNNRLDLISHGPNILLGNSTGHAFLDTAKNPSLKESSFRTTSSLKMSLGNGARRLAANAWRTCTACDVDASVAENSLGTMALGMAGTCGPAGWLPSCVGGVSGDAESMASRTVQINAATHTRSNEARTVKNCIADGGQEVVAQIFSQPVKNKRKRTDARRPSQWNGSDHLHAVDTRFLRRPLTKSRTPDFRY